MFGNKKPIDESKEEEPQNGLESEIQPPQKAFFTETEPEVFPETSYNNTVESNGEDEEEVRYLNVHFASVSVLFCCPFFSPFFLSLFGTKKT